MMEVVHIQIQISHNPANKLQLFNSSENLFQSCLLNIDISSYHFVDTHTCTHMLRLQMSLSNLSSVTQNILGDILYH